MEQRVGIFIADKEACVRSALRLLLGQEAGLRIAGDAGNHDALLAGLTATAPRLLVLDCELPGLAGRRPVDALKSRWPSLKVVALGTSQDAGLSRCLGADALCSKLAPPEGLIECVHRLLAEV